MGYEIFYVITCFRCPFYFEMNLLVFLELHQEQRLTLFLFFYWNFMVIDTLGI